MQADRSELYQPLQAATLSDPYPTYRQLQAEAPIFWHGDLFAWVLTRYRDCRRVLQDPAKYTRDRRKLGRPVLPEGMNIQSEDPPDQIPLRRALLRAMEPAHLAAAIREATEDLERRIGAQSAGHAFDFMSEIAAPVAMRFACSLVGLPKLKATDYLPIFLGLTRAMDSALDSRRDEEGLDATRALVEMVRSAQRSPTPGSVIFQLHAAPEVRQMPEAYVRNTLAATFNAAFSTAYSSMGSFLLLALQRDGTAQQIAKADSMAASVQELLRFTSPAQSTRRYALCDTMIDGVHIQQNDPIVTLIAAANRDPEMFEQPNDLVLGRSPNPHLAFAVGPHHCAGARPASAFLEAFIGGLTRWQAPLRLAAAPAWLDTFTLRCIERLPVVRAIAT